MRAGLVRHLLHEGEALHGHRLARQAPAVHAADGEVFEANGKLGVGQRAGGLLRGLDRIDLQSLRGNARALLSSDFPRFGKAERVGPAGSEHAASQGDAHDAQPMYRCAARDRTHDATARRGATLAGSAGGRNKHDGPRN